MPGQFDQQQQAPQQQSAQPQQTPQQPSPDEQALRQSLVQQATPPPEQRSSGVKGMLQNFFKGFGNSAMKEAGLPTQYDIQQKALQNLNTYDSNQAMIRLHESMAQQLQLTPIQLGDGTTVQVAQKDVAGLINRMMQSASAGNVAQTNVLGGIAKAQINQGMMMPIPEELRQQLGLPEGTTQLPLKQFQEAIGAATKPLTTVQGANDQFQVNRITQQKTPLGVGNPRIAAQNARPVQVADPTVPGGIRYMPAGEAMRQGVQAPSSATVKVPAAVMKDFTSGKSAQTLNSFNTATDHLKILSDLGDALNNGNYPTINSLANRFATATGGAAPTTFDMAKQAVAGEVAKTFKGQATEGEISAINSTLNKAQSPAQLKGAINTALTLMNSKREALMKQYDQGIKSQPAFPGGTPPTAGFAAWKAKQNGQ